MTAGVLAEPRDVLRLQGDAGSAEVVALGTKAQITVECGHEQLALQLGTDMRRRLLQRQLALQIDVVP